MVLFVHLYPRPTPRRRLHVILFDVGRPLLGFSSTTGVGWIVAVAGRPRSLHTAAEREWCVLLFFSFFSLPSLYITKCLHIPGDFSVITILTLHCLIICIPRHTTPCVPSISPTHTFACTRTQQRREGRSVGKNLRYVCCCRAAAPLDAVVPLGLVELLSSKGQPCGGSSTSVIRSMSTERLALPLFSSSFPQKMHTNPLFFPCQFFYFPPFFKSLSLTFNES